ncbi:Disease resistance protein [Rhynchospora pubera]|uniref:Disease resistance protein n=1 Tax=Rhynchospora pubera TaxID=906938 RepID=A0AAV8BQV6_9POAL|nr:Disease resistance protein [Rhynchospora pubera]
MAERPNPTSCEPPLVGFEADKRKIMSALLDTSEPRFSVVHIVGPRGVGKTHLAKEIYTSPEVQKHFRVRIWVPASRACYGVEVEYLKNMRAQLSIEQEADIARFLMGKRYCVVIDDQDWRSYSRRKAWNYILGSELPKSYGSRVLVTCRPEYGRSRYPVSREFEVGPRSNEESLEILLKAAFPKYPWEGCPAGEVDDLVMKFVRKCKGLPWPLQFMGDLLSLHPWNEVLDRIQTIEAAGMNFVDLAMRYRDLSSHEMRAAFLYFLTFPEDAEIHAKSFALLLKSEGITRRSEQGEDILQLLAERSTSEMFSED